MTGVPLHVAPRPCNTCPYRCDTPPGVWHPDEYEKLARYDDQPDGQLPALATFHCHQENATGDPTVCRGWLSVHAESPAVRLAIIDGKVTVDQVYAEADVDLYESGAEAQAAGIAAVAAPGGDAVDAIRKLVRRGAGRPD